MHTQKALLDHLEQHLKDTLELVRQNLNTVEDNKLRLRPDIKRWNALECFAHLNSYCDYYLPQIEQAIHKAKARQWPPQTERTSTWFGRKSIASVNPDTRTTKRTKTFKNHNHLNKDLDRNALKAFLINTEMLLRMVGKAREVDLSKAKVSFQAFPLFKLNLADILEFLTLHQRRHSLQAIEAAGVSTSVTIH